MTNSKHSRGQHRGRWAVDTNRVLASIALFVFPVAVALLASCSTSQKSAGPNAGAADTVTSAVPPFSTKEPQRYRALRITTFTESAANTGAPVNETSSSSVLLARDGEKRREEFSVKGGGRIVFVESPGGRFVLLPASKLYADLGAGSGPADLPEVPDEVSGASSDMLVNEAPAVASYRLLGTEILAGRTTTKYRVTSGMKPAEPEPGLHTETLIWIDETLGMPIRSETVHNDSSHSSKVVMELSDIQLDVDQSVFELPQDYQKVQSGVIFGLIRKRG